MAITDKRLVLDRIRGMDRVALDLGCGNRKHMPESIGIDAIDYECVDIVGEIFEVLQALPSGSVDDIYSSHFFEHVVDLRRLINELARVQKPGGSLTVLVPHFSNPYFYSDYSHKAFFGLYTFSYLSTDLALRRKVPNYEGMNDYNLLSVEYVFTSPFYGRRYFKKVIGHLINLNKYMKELYEENFCYLFPCYEIKYRLVRSGN